MASGGRVIYKKTTTGKNRKDRLKHDGDDDEDEEYVLEEDEDEESESNFESNVNSCDLSDEENFDFCESDRSYDAEEEKEITKSKKKQGNRGKSMVSDDEMDADYELDEEEEEKEVEIVSSKKKRRNLKKSRLAGDEMDPDYELDDEEEEEKEFNIVKSKKKKQITRKKLTVSYDERESDYEMDGEKELKIGKSIKKQGHCKKPRISDDEMDSDYKVDGMDEEKEVKIARLAKKRRNLKKSRLSDDQMDPDYELDHEDEVKEVKIGSSKKNSMVSYNDVDLNYELDDEEVDEEFEIGRSKKKQGDCNKNRFFYDEMEDLLIPKRQRRGRLPKKDKKDSDYELDHENEGKRFKSARSKGNHKKSRVYGDEDEEKEPTIARSKKCKGNHKTSRVSNAEMEDILVPIKRGKGRPRKQNSRDSDYELDDEDDDDEDFSPDEDDFDEDEISIASKQMAKASRTKGRMKKRRNGMIRSSDDEFVVKDRVSVGRKRKRSKNVRKRSSEADLTSLDLDFVSSDDDFVEKDIIRIHNRRKNNKKVTKGTGLKVRRKKRSAETSESSDSDFVISDDDDVEDDDDFNVKDHVVLDKQEKKREKEKVGEANRRKIRKRSVYSDSDYLISEDDEDFIVAEGHGVVDRQPKMSKKARKKRSRSSVESDTDSFDFDDAISEEEVRDLRIGGGLNREKPKRFISGKKVEEKGKEKQADDSWKQVCGICLSEEKNSVVQGLLDCCTHYFCFACIMEWSKVESRCPLCKRRFVTISKLGMSSPGLGIRSSVIRVEKRDQVYQPSDEELRGIIDPYENVVCMECQQGGDDSLMLLCDTCDSSAHTYCVGLGREVPEGNWYCECCRPVSDGPSNPQFQDTALNQEISNNNLFSSISERSGFSSMHANINSPRRSSLRIDLNALPRDFPSEDPFVSTPTYGSGPSTVSGRRHIRQRIHVILSNNRQRQTDAEATVLASMNLNLLPSESSFEQRQQNLRPLFSSDTNLVPCMFNEGGSFRHVDHAKEEVQHLVKYHLKNLSQNRRMDGSTLEEIAQISTHTILAACGIEHRRNMVPTAIEPPENCAHDSNDGPSHLLKGCCSSCFESFVKDVVRQKIIDTAF